MLLTPVIYYLLCLILNRRQLKLNMQLHMQTMSFLFSYIKKISIETRENPEYKTQEDMAFEVLENATNSIDICVNFFAAILQIITIVSIVSTLNAIIVLIIIVLVIINTVITRINTEKKNKFTSSLFKLARYMNDYEMPLRQLNYAVDVNVYNLSNFFFKKYFSKKNESDEMQLKQDFYSQLSSLSSTSVSFVQDAVLFSYMIYNVLKLGMPIGNITIYSNAANSFAAALNNLLTQYLSMVSLDYKISETRKYLSVPISKLPRGDKTPTFNSSSEIEFKNVYFKYPGCDNYVLKNINLKVKGNEKICIVGNNGAGKTTLIKLLLRMYTPTEGEILLNGVNINEYDPCKYWDYFAPVYQDINIFHSLTIKENIVFDSIYNDEQFRRICSNVKIDEYAESLPKQYDTIIGKWIEPDGVILSGGIEQRIAIARAVYRDRNIYILDEPTASLDPNMEYEIYSQFNNIITNKCAILITHRLSAVQLADKVVVMDNGNLIEYGTHGDLYSKGGKYAEMFDKQAEFYVKAQIE